MTVRTINRRDNNEIRAHVAPRRTVLAHDPEGLQT
jgi:hypothetical protein